jgi:hypothetical protein
MAQCLGLLRHCHAHHRGAAGRLHTRDVSKQCSVSSDVVVGVGGVGIDYLASVATFPKPDQKLRTEMLGIQGGGNCGNSMTGVARLGLQCRILSTVGTDSLGDSVIAEFEADGVSTEFLNRQEGAATPFTYIIVDESGQFLIALEHQFGVAPRRSSTSAHIVYDIAGVNGNVRNEVHCILCDLRKAGSACS